MKTGLIVTARGKERERQLGEMFAFLKRSGLEDAQNEIWTVVSETPVMADLCLAALEARFDEVPKDLLLFASGVRGNELATRLAARLNGDAFCGARQGDFSGQVSFTRPVYGSAMTGTFTAGEPPWCVSVARSVQRNAMLPRLAEYALSLDFPSPPWVVTHERLSEALRASLEQARFVIAAGLGVGSAQNMARVKELAAQLGAETGASRQVVMNAWCEMESLIGMSGSVIAPDVCIAAGVSGASAFSVGIRESGLIVAINTDPDAAIFAGADVVIVDELLPVLEALAVQQKSDGG